MNEYKMTPFQKNIWDMVKRFEKSNIGNVGGSLFVKREMDEDFFRKMMERVMWLNPALRLRFKKNGSMYLSESKELMIDVMDLSHLTNEEIDAYMQKLFCTPLFAYDRPLVHCYMIRRSDDWALMGTFHHICLDGVGFQRITQQIYELCSDAESPLWDEETKPDMRYIQFLENSQTATEKHIEKGLRWFGELCKPERFVFPQRRGGESFQAGVYYKEISGRQYEKVMEWQVRYGLTIEQIYQAAYLCYSSRISGSPWSVIGRVLINRKKSNMDVAGMFTNTLPLVVKVEDPCNFWGVCQEVKRLDFEMLKYSDISQQQIRQECQIKGKLYETYISYRPMKRMPRDNQRVAKILVSDAVEVPLHILIDDRENNILFTYRYMLDSYTEEEIAAMDAYLWEMMDQSMQLQAECVEMKPFSPQNTICRRQTGMDIVDAFLKTVETHPDMLFWKDLSMKKPCSVSFREAYDKMLKVAGSINELLGSYPSQKQMVVALALRRTYRMPLAMLSCLYLGIIFYPVNVEEKGRRREEIRKGVSLWIDDKQMDCWLRSKVPVDDVKQVKCMEKTIAYAISTSGSTGEPKLVQVRRDSLNIRLHWMMETFGMKGCRVLQKTRNTFDVSIWELLLPAMSQGSLVLLPDGQERSPEKIWQAVVSYHIDKIHFVPSMLEAFLSWVEVHQNQSGLEASLTDVFVSGEMLPASLAERFHRNLPHVKLHNLYGPAECTIDVSYHTCVPGEKVIPIGKPVWNTGLWVVNSKREEIPQGYIGEILITGDLVGEGYMNHASASSERFLMWNGEKGYATQDLGYVDSNGELVYVGRINREVKLRGMRVHLSVLEQEVTQIEQIDSAAALVHQNHLILFVKTLLKESEIRERLMEHVAPHYVPDRIVIIPEIPVNLSGKCDYNELMKQYHNKMALGQKESGVRKLQRESIELEETIADCVYTVLGTRINSMEASLFEHGLDSLSTVSLLVELEKRGYDIHYEDIYAAGNIETLAETLLRKQVKKRTCSLHFYPDWNKKKQLIVGVAFAGAHGSVFHNLASCLSKQNYGFAYCELPPNKTDISQMATEIVSSLCEVCDIKKMPIAVLGCCVGAALAMEIVRSLKRIGAPDCRLILEGSLPTYFLAGGQNKLVWDYLPKQWAQIVLSRLNGQRVTLSDSMYDQLKNDSHCYVQYFENMICESRIPTDTLMIFGEKDDLTRGFRRKYKAWNQYLSGHVHIMVIKKARHFASVTNAPDVADCIVKYLNS